PNASAAQQSTSRDTATLEPVVITATRVDVKPVAPLASTTVITGQELRARGITTLGDALAGVPGVFAPQSGSYGAQTSLFLRGGESDYTEILVDGVPVNDPGGAIDLANLTVDNIDRIEIVRGPASVLYGSNAVTGVIQIFTKTGTGLGGPGQFSLGLDGGTYGTSNANASYAGGDQGLGGSASISRHRTDGIYAINSSNRNDIYSGQFHLAPDAKSSLQLMLRDEDAGAHIPTNFFGAVVDSNQFHLEHRFLASLAGDRRLTDRLTARIQLDASDEHSHSADLPVNPGDECDFCFNSQTGIYRRSGDARLDFAAAPWAQLTGGATAEQQRARESGANPIQRTLHAYYAQALGNAGKAFSYTAGIRVDDNSQFGTFTTYRLAAGYVITPGTNVHASVGDAFKEPTFDETTSDIAFARGNPALRPERSRSWEAGLDQDVAHGALVLSATYFAQRFRDMIQYDASSPDTTLPNYFNLAAATSDGLELGARTGAWRGLSLNASYTWQHTDVTDAGVDGGPGATFVDGQRLLRRPTNLANATLSFRRSPRGAVFATATYIGNRVDIDFLNFVRVEAPSYTLYDLAGELTVIDARGATPALTLTGRIANLFGTRYEPIFGYRGAGMAVDVGARLTWGEALR
ncbi:MAG: TonB-dependent receptor plug domain-containing protein, partial [Gemmatimonadaceae bacterium]